MAWTPVPDVEDQKSSKVKILSFVLLFSALIFVVAMFFFRQDTFFNELQINERAETTFQQEYGDESVSHFFDDRLSTGGGREDGKPQNLREFKPQKSCELEGRIVISGTVVSDATCGD